jgi:hypothetical protein
MCDFMKTRTALYCLAALVGGVCLDQDPAAAPRTAQTKPAPANMSFFDNGRIRVGIDLTVGGSITWLSLSGENRSVVNVHDRGREIQMSHYSGPTPP